MSKLNPYAKAIAGGLVAGLFAWLGVRDGGITSEEWTTVLFAVVSGSGLVWLVPNVPAPRPLNTGGPVSRGKPYVVGNGDREAFVPLTPGYVRSGYTTGAATDAAATATFDLGRRPDDPPLGAPIP